MDILRKILYALIGVLIIIIAAGGGYLALTGGHLGGHGNTQQTAQNQQNTTTQSNEASPQQPDQTSGINGQPHQTPGTATQQPQNPETTGQQAQNPEAQGQQPQTGGTTGQQPVQVTPPAAYPATPPVRTIDPEPYYDRLNKAQEIIEDANKMITVDPFADTGGKDTANSGADMSKLHQGIYKMSQGMTIMEETLDTLNKDIKGDTGFAPNPGQSYYPGPGYYPYQGYYQPNTSYGYNPQNPYNQVPGGSYQQQPQPGQTQPNNQTNPNQADNQQIHQPQADQSTNHGTSAANSLANIPIKTLFTYIAYGILVASIIGVFVAILGMANSLFKKPESTKC